MKVFLVCLGLVFGVGVAGPAEAYDCQAVRSYVGQYGVKAAYRWAKSQGYSWVEIAAVKVACFGGGKK